MGAFCPAQDSSFTASAGGRFLLNPALDRLFFRIGAMIHDTLLKQLNPHISVSCYRVNCKAFAATCLWGLQYTGMGLASIGSNRSPREAGIGRRGEYPG